MKKLPIILLALALVFGLAACGGKDKEKADAPPAGDAQTLLLSAQNALSAGNLEQAVRDFKASIAANPSLDAYFGLGNAYNRMGRFSDAQKAYEEALKINPNHIATLSNMGVAFYQQGQLNKAKETFEKVLALESNDAATHYLLGATYMQLSDLAKAEEQFQAALKIQPDLPEAHYGMAVLYRERGEIDKAISELETFLSGPPAQDPRAQVEAQKLLDQLKSQ